MQLIKPCRLFTDSNSKSRTKFIEIPYSHKASAKNIYGKTVKVFNSLSTCIKRKLKAWISIK